MERQTIGKGQGPRTSAAAAVLYLARQGWREQGPGDRPDAGAEEIAEAAVFAGYGALVWESVRRGSAAERRGFESLEPVYRAAIVHDLRRAGPRAELLEALDGARERGVLRRPAVLLKGGHLHRTLFPGRAHLRPMQDLDVLVDRRDLDGARRILAELGYRPRVESGPELRRRWINEESWLRPIEEPVSAVDLHTEMGHHVVKRPWANELLAAARPLPGAPPAFGLAPKHLAISIAVHAALHRFRRTLRAVIDLDLVLEGEGLRPEDLRVEGPLCKSSRTPLSVTLSLLTCLRQKAFPESCRQRHEPGPWAWRHHLMVQLVHSDLLRPAPWGTPRTKLGNYLRILLSIDEPMRRPLYLGFMAFLHVTKRLGFGEEAVSQGAAAAVAEVGAGRGSARDYGGSK